MMGLACCEKVLKQALMDKTSPIPPSSGDSFDQPGWVYERIRDEIVSGRLGPNERLKIAELAARYGTSTNPVREALQQLRGEGFVLIEPNRGARVRPIDEDFVRDIIEIEVLIEPALTRWFVSIATDADIAALEAVQAEIEELNFSDPVRHAALDTRFHQLIYDRHYNRHAAVLWWTHREILRAISRRFPTSLSRRVAVLREHRELVECIRAQDADGAAKVVARHVEGSGRHVIEQMGAARRMSQSTPSPASKKEAR
ncbi:transcriptional regulator [Labrys miyagiensis]|uniref:Transcriptional regulator n=2 Tax=Labrys miyagiensis TaxID=346912 RepID=A0ABQ6CNH0_9HYPH|nr:transcriptional regulator [Labrys miyagiensis]